ncbi:MAG: hypothetical protein K8M05_36275 [Deltaproteobacteria bacterium]|nr:hypothetical protein [Kofleriaceae bacterium]
MRHLAGSVFALSALAVISCGSPQRPAGGGGAGSAPAGDGGGDVAVGTGPGVTPANVCARIAELRTQGCELSTLPEEECRDELHRALEERGPDSRTATMQLGRCMLDNESCDAIAACVDALVSEAEPRTCEQGGGGAVVLPRAEWEQRHGAGATRYSSVKTTKAEPVEVCGIPAQMEWLLGATCDDGSRPFRDYDHAHSARVGNVGEGGRCGSIIDLYEVPCPEGTYSIFIDAYVCPAD